MTQKSFQWRPKPMVRAIALGVIWRGPEILVEKVRNDLGEIRGWRPLGGGIDFGERGADALVREFMEELGLAIRVERPMTTLENLYRHYDVAGHEIALVYAASFSDPASYQRDYFEFLEGDVESFAQWKNVSLFQKGSETLFPQDLLDHLKPENLGVA